MSDERDWYAMNGPVEAVSDMAMVLSLISTHERRSPNQVLRDAIAAYQGPPPERAILTDLIAEQRELHHRMGFVCSLCVTEWPCQCVESLNRAEARLREVSDE